MKKDTTSLHDKSNDIISRMAINGATNSVVAGFSREQITLDGRNILRSFWNRMPRHHLPDDAECHTLKDKMFRDSFLLQRGLCTCSFYLIYLWIRKSL